MGHTVPRSGPTDAAAAVRAPRGTGRSVAVAFCSRSSTGASPRTRRRPLPSGGREARASTASARAGTAGGGRRPTKGTKRDGAGGPRHRRGTAAREARSAPCRPRRNSGRAGRARSGQAAGTAGSARAPDVGRRGRLRRAAAPRRTRQPRATSGSLENVPFGFPLPPPRSPSQPAATAARYVQGKQLQCSTRPSSQ